MRHETLLLEIGTEELPPKSLLALKIKKYCPKIAAMLVKFASE